MTTTTIPGARQRNQAAWRRSAAALYAGRMDEFLADWHHDAAYEVAYPVDGAPARVQGHDALLALFSRFTAAAERIRVEDVRFHQTDDPDVAFVEERMRVDLRDGWRYENRLVLRVTFREGRIAEIVEYYGERVHAELLRRLGVVS
jgi:ketosteroid isomerase-like protein